jgi:hypothetical protein
MWLIINLGKDKNYFCAFHEDNIDATPHIPNLATSVGKWPTSVPAQRAPDTHRT